MLKSLILGAGITAAAMLSACDSAPATQNSVEPKPVAVAQSLIDINTVDAFQLAGVEVLTDAMQDALLQNRPFATPSDLHAVVSEKADAPLQIMIYKKLFVPINANSAAEADIKLVPSVLTPKKLAHEVDEYRPYADMDQFKRELGKYMGPAEIETLSAYFFVE